MNDYQTDCCLTSFKFSIETLLEEIKPVPTKNYEFDFRHKSLRIHAWIFRNVRILMQKNQPTEIPTKPFFSDVCFFVTLMKEIKPVVTEKH